MDLKELLGEELYGQVNEKLGDEHKIALVSDGSFIPKEKFNEKNTELKELKNQLKERDEQLEELSGKAKGNEELTNQIESLKEENKKKTEELQNKLDQTTFDFLLEKDLMSAKAINPKAVKALLDLETIKRDGEKLIGLEEQRAKHKESDANQFNNETEPEPPKPNRFTPGPTQKNNRNAKDGDLYAEAQELFKNKFNK